MNKLGGKIILWGLVLGMLVFTAIRTLHFLMLTFPPDQQYVAFLALAAFDIGVLGWFYFATSSAEGAAQRTVSYGMIFVCAAGVIITTVGDMMNVSAQNGLTTTPGWWFTAALWGVILVVVLNVLAGIVVHLVDPKHQRHLAQETARDSIHKATLESIKQKAGELAPRIADQVTQAWEDETYREMTGHLPIRRSLPAPRTEVRELPAGEAGMDGEEDAWLARVNARVEQERRQRLAQGTGLVNDGGLPVEKQGFISRLKERVVGPDPVEVGKQFPDNTMFLYRDRRGNVTGGGGVLRNRAEARRALRRRQAAQGGNGSKKA